MTMFDISVEFQALHDLMQDEFNEETGELINKDSEVKELFDNLKLSLDEKLNDTQRYIFSLRGEQEVLGAEIKRLQAKKSSIKNKEDRLRGLMLSTLEVANKPKLKTDFYSFSIQKRESVNVLDEDKLARKYLKIKYEADKSKIKKDIKDGEEIEGAEIKINKFIGVR